MIHVRTTHCRREQCTCDKGSRRRSEQKTLTTCEAKTFPHCSGAIGPVNGHACPPEGGYIPRRDQVLCRRGLLEAPAGQTVNGKNRRFHTASSPTFTAGETNSVPKLDLEQRARSR